MTTIQLRRYQIRPGELGDFMAWWQSHLWPARELFGFDLEFAYVIEEEDAFVWAVSYPGGPEEFVAADAAWVESEGRAQALATAPERVLTKQIATVSRTIGGGTHHAMSK